MKLITLTATALVASATVTAAPPAIPFTPAPVQDILFAQSFTLTTGYTYGWSKERPTVTSGQIVVFQVNPDLVYPRQIAEPMLYVGSISAERLNVGYTSGRVVAIIPDTAGNDGKLAPQDLSRSWFGRPALPSEVDAAMVSAEARLASNAGVLKLTPDKVDAARTAAGNEAARLEGKHELLGLAARLLRQYSPDETDLIANYEHTATLK